MAILQPKRFFIRFAVGLAAVLLPSTPCLAAAGGTAPDTSRHNPLISRDVNGDGVVSRHDVIVTIKLLNDASSPSSPVYSPTGATGEFHFPYPPPPFPDTTGDGYIVPMDALYIINYLNSAP